MRCALLSLLLLVVRSANVPPFSESFEVQYIFPPEIIPTAETSAGNNDDSRVAFGSVTHDGRLLLAIEHAPKRLYLKTIEGEWITLQLKRGSLVISGTEKARVQIIPIGGEKSALEEGMRVDCLPLPALVPRNCRTTVKSNHILEVSFAEGQPPISISFIPVPVGGGKRPNSAANHQNHRQLSKVFVGDRPQFHRYKTATHLSLWLPPAGGGRKYGPCKPFITLDIYLDIVSTLHGSYYQGFIFRKGQRQAMPEIAAVEAGDIVAFVPISFPLPKLEGLEGILRSTLSSALPQVRLLHPPHDLSHRQIIAMLII